jgi:ketosteroid isomerase-like protein
MPPVLDPRRMNAAFAEAINRRDLQAALALYEPAALLCPDQAGTHYRGHVAIAGELQRLMALPGTLQSINVFCAEADGLALLRAEFTARAADGTVLAEGSTAEIVRRQADGSWRYVIDHAAGPQLS